MGGSFGYKSEYYELSMDIGESLSEQFEAAGDRTVVASGTLVYGTTTTTPCRRRRAIPSSSGRAVGGRPALRASSLFPSGIEPAENRVLPLSLASVPGHLLACHDSLFV